MSFSNPRPASISVDFGTSHTVATIRRADGRVHQQLFDGAPQLPSAVFMNDEGGPVVGADAVHSGRRKPDRYEPNPKRRIDDAQILLGETEIPVTSVIAAVLSRVARECEQTLGALGPVTVTVPAAWGPTRRHVVADAATAAGLGTVDLVAEPVAAASYFVETIGANVPPGSGVVVYDLGGGTFDATVLRRATAGFDVLAVDGADDLGGLDFDQALAEHIAATVQPAGMSDAAERWARLTSPTEPADLRHRAAFMEEVRQAKERLSRSASTELTIPLLDVDVHLTRDELEQVCTPLVERTIRVTQGVIRESGLAKEQIAGLFLVGAASRMPLVATLLHRELGIAPSAIEQPELAVSEGGLVAQHTISTPISVPSPALPPQTATPVVAPVPGPVSAPTGQTMRLPQPSAPPTSQPTPQSLPGSPPQQFTQPHMAAPSPPPGQYPTGPIAPQKGPWIKSKQGVLVLSAVALVIVVAFAAIAIPAVLTERDNDDLNSSSENSQDENPTGANAEATEDDTDGSAATGDDDGPVPLAEAVQGDLVAEMASQHVGAITQVEVGQVDGANVVLTGGEDGMVRIWNPADGKLVDEYRGHEGSITSLGVVTESSGRVAVFSSDGTTDDTWYLDEPETTVADRESQYDSIYWYGLWDGTPAYATDYEVKQLFTGNVITDISTSYGEGLRLADVGGTLRAVTHYENRVVVTDLATGDPVGGTFDQLAYDIMALTAGQAAGKSLAITVTGEGAIQAWDLATAEPYGTPAQELYQTVTGLRVIEIDGKAAVLAFGDKGLSLFDLESGAQIGESFAEHTGDEALAAAEVTEIDGHQVVITGTATGLVEVWSL